MVLINITMPPEEYIMKKESFVVDSIIPVAIRATGNNTQYLFLFAACEECDERYMYFQILVQSENEIDTNFLTKHYLNINNLKSDSRRLKAYTEIMQKLGTDNLFSTDFNIKKDENSLYYHSRGVRPIGENKAHVVDIYFSLKCFVKLKLYLHRCINVPMISTCHENIFRDESYNNISVEKIESIKMDCTKVEDNGDISSLYTTHYTINLGIKVLFKFNYMITDDKNKNVKFIMDSNLYNDLYNKDTLINEIFYDNNFVYLVYREMSIIDGSLKSIKLLKMDKELANKNTNILNPNNIFI